MEFYCNVYFMEEVITIHKSGFEVQTFILSAIPSEKMRLHFTVCSRFGHVFVFKLRDGKKGGEIVMFLTIENLTLYPLDRTSRVESA